MKSLEELIKGKLEEPIQRDDVFEARNRKQFINQNVMSVVWFYSGPVKFTSGGLTESTGRPASTEPSKVF